MIFSLRNECIITVCMCMMRWGLMCHRVSVEVRGQLWRAGSHLSPLCGFRGSPWLPGLHSKSFTSLDYLTGLFFFLLQAIVLEKNGINGQESSLSVALLPLPRCVMWPNPGHRSLPFVTGCFFYLSSFWFSYWAVASAHGSALLFRLLWFLWPKVPSLSLFDKL